MIGPGFVGRCGYCKRVAHVHVVTDFWTKKKRLMCVDFTSCSKRAARYFQPYDPNCP